MNTTPSLSHHRPILRVAVSLVIASLISTGMYARVEHLKAVEARYQTIEAERKAEIAEARASAAERKTRELQALLAQSLSASSAPVVPAYRFRMDTAGRVSVYLLQHGTGQQVLTR